MGGNKKMNNKKNIRIIILAVATIILAAVVFVVIKQNSDHVGQKNQKQEAVSKETLRKQKEKEGKRSLEMIKKGYVKMLTGEVVKVDSGAKNFIIDIDPLGKHEKYVVYVNEKTKFSVLSTEGSVSEVDNEIEVPKKSSPADFSDLTELSQVNVTLNKWVENIHNINDGNQQLVAEKVDIIIE